MGKKRKRNSRFLVSGILMILYIIMLLKYYFGIYIEYLKYYSIYYDLIIVVYSSKRLLLCSWKNMFRKMLFALFQTNTNIYIYINYYI